MSLIVARLEHVSYSLPVFSVQDGRPTHVACFEPNHYVLEVNNIMEGFTNRRPVTYRKLQSVTKHTALFTCVSDRHISFKRICFELFCLLPQLIPMSDFIANSRFVYWAQKVRRWKIFDFVETDRKYISNSCKKRFREILGRVQALFVVFVKRLSFSEIAVWYWNHYVHACVSFLFFFSIGPSVQWFRVQ